MPDDFAAAIGALQAHVAAHGVDEAAVQQANALDERFVVALELDAFAHILLALIGQRLGQAGAAGLEIHETLLTPIAAPVGTLARHDRVAAECFNVVLRERDRLHGRDPDPSVDAQRIRQYVAFQATWWRP